MRTLFLLTLLMIGFEPMSAQYFNRLVDYDSTQEFGIDVLFDNNRYIMVSTSIVPGGNRSIVWLELDENGNTVNAKTILGGDPLYYDLAGVPNLKKLSNNKGYIVPMNIAYDFYNRTRWIAGLCRLDSDGDTLFFKGYTDTSINKEILFFCDTTSDGGYILGGRRLFINGDYHNYRALVQRMDSLGNLTWSKEFIASNNKGTTINSIETLPNGNILIGAMSIIDRRNGQLTYTQNAPWFLISDSLGNTLYQKDYPLRLIGGGTVHTDKNGGYYHLGSLDSFITSNSLDIVNLPSYVAHLDDSFNIDWMYNFADIAVNKTVWGMKQTKDSGYVAYGNSNILGPSALKGWLVKFDKQGNLMWERTYHIDTSHDGYFADVCELDDGGFIMTGMHRSTATLTRYQDAWVVRVDSMGCPAVQCAFPTPVDEIVNTDTDPFIVYPNPTMGELHVKCNEAGLFVITDIAGREILRKQLAKGNNKLYFPANVTGGIYMARFKTATTLQTVKIIYNP